MKIGKVDRTKVVTVEVEMKETEWVALLSVLADSTSGWANGTVHDALSDAVFPPMGTEGDDA